MCETALATVIPQVRAQDVLRGLVSSLGQAADRQGIHEEEDLEPVTGELQRLLFRERYERSCTK